MIAFALPLGGLYYFLSNGKPEGERRVAINATQPLTNYNITKEGQHLAVHDDGAISPNLDSDFMFWMWLRLRRLPLKNERVYLASKYNANQGFESGFALALERVSNGLRPLVYWRGPSGSGGWYRFAEVELLPDNWYLIAFSWHSDGLLSIHMVPQLPTSQAVQAVQLLGSHAISWKQVVNSDRPLLLGAIGNGNFRGALGPVGALRVSSLRKVLVKTLQEMAENPTDLPSILQGSEILFWSPDLRTDLGPLKHKIKVARRGGS